jgi:hypothetical protein
MRGLLPLLCLCLAAQENDPPKRPKETLALLDQARSLPPEFSADVLLKLAATRVIPDAKWKREVIEEAFTAGSHAQLPYARRAWGQQVESRWSQEYAANDLESLTLESRAVEAMLNLDPQRGAAMFSEIVFPALIQEKCDEPAVAYLDPYYRVAGMVFERGFTTRQREKEEHLHFVEQQIARMQHPAQVHTVLKLIFTVKVSDDERIRLLTAYAVALDRISGNDRAFGAYESQYVPVFRPDVAASSMLLNALRSFIVRQVTGPRCSDNLVAGKLPASIAMFNSLAARVDPGAGWLKPLTPEETKPGKDEGTYPPQRGWASKRAKDVLEVLRWLDHGTSDPVVKWTSEQRKSREWMDHFNDLLKTIEGWKVEEESSPEDYLITVALTYGLAAAGAPPGPPKENVMGRYLNFLETRYAETANRNLWFTQMQALLRTAHWTQDPAERAWILERFGRSANPIISLYAGLEEIQGPAKR